jgi:hypothetical protein
MASMPPLRSGVVGTLWSGVAMLASMRQGLRRGHFVDDVTIDVDQRRAIVALLDQMRIPELVVERFAGHQTVSSSACFYAPGLEHFNNPLACEVDPRGLH